MNIINTTIEKQLSGESYGKALTDRFMNMTIEEYYADFQFEMNKLLNLSICKYTMITSKSNIYNLKKIVDAMNLCDDTDPKTSAKSYRLNMFDKNKILELIFFPITHKGKMYQLFDMNIRQYLEYLTIYIPYNTYDELKLEKTLGMAPIRDEIIFALDFYDLDTQDKVIHCLSDCIFGSLEKYKNYLDKIHFRIPISQEYEELPFD